MARFACKSRSGGRRTCYPEKPGAPLKGIEQPEPKLRPGGAVVKVAAAPILSFMKRVVSGELGDAMTTPWVPALDHAERSSGLSYAMLTP